MTRVLVNEASLQDIAEAIRYKYGDLTTYTPSEMGDAIRNIPSEGGGAVLIEKTISENGTYIASNDNANGYSTVVVNVSGGGSAGFSRAPSFIDSSVTTISVSAMEVSA